MNGNRLHLLYAIGILTALLIGSLSVQWNDVKGLPEIFSFALGFASLILAVIAIFQALNSTSTLSVLLGSLEKSAADIRNSVSTIEGTAETVVSTTKRHTTTLSDVRDTFINRLTQAEAGQEIGENAEAVEGGPKLETALSKNTFGGHLSTYILARAVATGKSFKGKDLFPDKPIYENYVNGFVSALISTGVVGGKFQSKGLFSITDIKGNPDNIAKEVKEILTTQSKNKDRAAEFLSGIDAHFDNDESDVE